LNALAGDVEIGGQIAALALLDFPSNVFSHAFDWCFVRPALAFVQHQHHEHPPAAAAVFGDDDDDVLLAAAIVAERPDSADQAASLLALQLDDIAIDPADNVVRGDDDNDDGACEIAFDEGAAGAGVLCQLQVA
jgi:hypothetical protein